jgi:hypothetical protein
LRILYHCRCNILPSDPRSRGYYRRYFQPTDSGNYCYRSVSLNYPITAVPTGFS